MIAKEHKKNKTKQKKNKEKALLATILRRELNLSKKLEPENEAPTFYARKVKQNAKLYAQDQLKQKKWEDNQCMGSTQKQ